MNRVQYSKLLALERKEMLNQKEISDNWVKYIFLLLEETMQHCERNNILFSNLDEFQQVRSTVSSYSVHAIMLTSWIQTLLLRNIANDLRKLSNLLPFDIVYDPLDASAVVSFVLAQEGSDSLASKYGLDRPAEEIHAGERQIPCCQLS